MVLNPYIVEFIGTLFFVFVILYTGNYLAIGSALALVIYFGSPISKIGSYNPAVTLSLFCVGKLPAKRVIPCILVEFLGALCAVGLIKLINFKSTKNS